MLFDKNKCLIQYRGCVLKPLKKREIRSLKTWFLDPETARQAFGMISKDETLNKVVDEYFQNIFFTSMEILGIFKDDRLTGFLNYFIVKIPESVGRIGIVIQKEEARGKGVGSTALKAALYFFFYHLGLERIELDTAFFNNRAQRCFEKCGFVKTGENTDIDILNNELIHKVYMQLNRKEFYNKLDNLFEGSFPVIQQLYWLDI